MVMNILKLIPPALLPAAAAFLIRWYEKRYGKPFSNTTRGKILIGVLFGVLSVIGSEFGVQIGDATINVRDAAPICAGLLFGIPSGAIAGLIGGIERFVAVAWGAGEYTRIACATATVIAGISSGVVRRRILDDRDPKWSYGLGLALMSESFHLLMVFLTHLEDPRIALTVVKQCTVPMILANAVAVVVAILAACPEENRRKPDPDRYPTLLNSFQRGLLTVVLPALAVSVLFLLFLQTKSETVDTDLLLQRALTETSAEIKENTDRELSALVRSFASAVRSGTAPEETDLAEGTAEYTFYGSDGQVLWTSVPGNEGKTIADSPRAEWLASVLGTKNNTTVFPRDISSPEDLAYAAASVRGGVLEIGLTAAMVQRDLSPVNKETAELRGAGETGQVFIAGFDGLLASGSDGTVGQALLELLPAYRMAGTGPLKAFKADVDGETAYCMVTEAEGYTVVATLPETEAMFSRDLIVYVTFFIEVIIFSVIFILLFIYFKKNIAENLMQISDSLGRISSGDLDQKVDVRATKEFSVLSDDINKTVDTIKMYIAKEAARLEQELELARTIQRSALPSVFPPYPYRTEFDIYALMDPAKEVGGDFYDFFILSRNTLIFMVADVSGKGIPAALFMMRAKTLMKSLGLSGKPLDEVLKKTNEQLCVGNDAGMFVTALLCALDVKTGVLTYANAGHNPPVVRKNGTYEYVKSKAGFVLGGMEGIKYKAETVQLEPGDMIYLYTDGVTEATDAEEKLFGEARLQESLEKTAADSSAEEICKKVKEAVDGFVGDAPQADDITMLCVRYHGKSS